MGNEKDFSRRVRASLKQSGCTCYPVETGGTASGFPDLVVVHKGGASFVELKSRRSVLIRQLADKSLEGPGQRAFGKVMAKRTAFTHGGCSVSERSFLLVECMDGVALMVEEEAGTYLAGCWEGSPSGEDLCDALRAWRICAMPSNVMLGSTVKDCLLESSRAYAAATGITVSLAGFGDSELGMTLEEAGGRAKALEIARYICDMGRYALLMESAKGETVFRQSADDEVGCCSIFSEEV